RERAVEPAAPAEAIESRAAVLEAAREPAVEVQHAPHQESPVPAAPKPHVVFNAVSEHDSVEAAAAHRPNRRRHHGAEGTAEGPAMQMVETLAAAPQPAFEDEAPRRTKPRRRRGAVAENEPLQLVETQGSSEPPADTPTP